MKKYLLLFTLSFSLFSCSTNEEESFSFEILPVSQDVVMPTAFAKDSVTEIPVKYIRPTSCHFFDGFYYDREDFTRTVAIYTNKINQEGCQIDNATEVTVTLKFKPTYLGTYHFKFWKGENAQGVDEFFEHDVVVDH